MSDKIQKLITQFIKDLEQIPKEEWSALYQNQRLFRTKTAAPGIVTTWERITDQWGRFDIYYCDLNYEEGSSTEVK